MKIFGSALLQPARSVCVSLSAFSHFIVRQHAVYAERDIVMANLSARLSVCLSHSGIVMETNAHIVKFSTV